VPELPEIQALAERLDAAFAGARIERIDPLGFSGLKTVSPPPDVLLGRAVGSVGRRGKYLVVGFGGPRLLVHLSQAGRLDVEEPAKTTRPKGAVVRFRFDDGRALLVREHGTERKAGWWVLAAGDDGPLAKLGPEPGSVAFDDVIRHGDDRRRVHTVLRDQRTVSGVGRGYADDAMHRARISPTATLASLTPAQREELLAALHATLEEALTGERRREGGLSAPKLGDRFLVHRRYGQPCPTCSDTLRRISYESYEITYCPTCQTKGRVLADRRLSRLVK
jgi:formamidopyrimidine-DNA glycosylase